MRIPYRTKKHVTVHPINTWKMAFTDPLWLLFIDQPQSDVILFTIIYSEIYIISSNIMKSWISLNYIITFKSSLENLLKSIVELTNIDELSHKYGVIIFNM